MKSLLIPFLALALCSPAWASVWDAVNYELGRISMVCFFADHGKMDRLHATAFINGIMQKDSLSDFQRFAISRASLSKKRVTNKDCLRTLKYYEENPIND